MRFRKILKFALRLPPCVGVKCPVEEGLEPPITRCCCGWLSTLRLAACSDAELTPPLPPAITAVAFILASASALAVETLLDEPPPPPPPLPLLPAEPLLFCWWWQPERSRGGDCGSDLTLIETGEVAGGGVLFGTAKWGSLYGRK